MFLYVLAMGIFFSLSALIAYIYVFNFLAKRNIDVRISKFILITVSTLGIMATFSFFAGDVFFRNDVMFFIITYTLSSIITGMIFKLKKSEKKEDEVIHSPAHK